MRATFVQIALANLIMAHRSTQMFLPISLVHFRPQLSSSPRTDVELSTALPCTLNLTKDSLVHLGQSEPTGAIRRFAKLCTVHQCSFASRKANQTKDLFDLLSQSEALSLP